MLLDLPKEVRLRAAANAAGADWIAALPELVGGLAQDWRLEVGATLHGGSEAYVAQVVMGDGRPAVLKVAPPWRDAASQELRVLLAAEGVGYVQVHAHDEARGAVLLEQLGPHLGELGWTAQAQMRAICTTLQSAWRPPEDPAGFMTGAEKAASLADFIEATWSELDRPCAERTIERALAFAEARGGAFSPERALLGHGDAHAGNTLAIPGEEGRFKFIDPDGLFIEPAYDLGVLMREWDEELLEGDPLELGLRRCELLASLTGVEREAVWQWGLMERTSTGLLVLKLGMDGGREMLAIADAWSLREG